MERSQNASERASERCFVSLVFLGASPQGAVSEAVAAAAWMRLSHVEERERKREREKHTERESTHQVRAGREGESDGSSGEEK